MRNAIFVLMSFLAICLACIMQVSCSQSKSENFSNFALFSADGTGLQRKGITPDILAYPTIETIKAGKDEILDAGINYLKKIHKCATLPMLYQIN